MASPSTPLPGITYDPPPGDVDLYSQVEDLDDGAGRWQDITVKGVTVRACKPGPAALKSLTAATNSSASAVFRNDMTTLFVQQHLHPDDWERVLVLMVDPAEDFDIRSLGEVMKSIATLGTARPTGPSSASRWRR